MIYVRRGFKFILSKVPSTRLYFKSLTPSNCLSGFIPFPTSIFTSKGYLTVNTFYHHFQIYVTYFYRK
eukprot:UN02341